MLIDSHCHMQLIKDINTEKLKQVIAEAKQNHVNGFLCVSVDLPDFHQMEALTKNFPEIDISCGIHPLHLDKKFDNQELIENSKKDDVCAIGETGLDYHYSQENKLQQQEVFDFHIDTACQLQKPIIVHTRSARQDTITMLKKYHSTNNLTGVLHCFTENWEMAKAALDLGFYISISGIVTFKSAAELQEIAKKIPADRLLIETDAPYLAPNPYRGKENQPKYLYETAKYISKLRNIDINELAAITTKNYHLLFKNKR